MPCRLGVVDANLSSNVRRYLGQLGGEAVVQEMDGLGEQGVVPRKVGVPVSIFLLRVTVRSDLLSSACQPYMAIHEDNARIDIVDHIGEALIVHHLACPGRIESAADRVQIFVVMKVRTNIVCELLKTSLLVKEFFALRLKRRRLRFHCSEGVGKRSEQTQGRVRIAYQAIQMTFGECKLVPVKPAINQCLPYVRSFGRTHIYSCWLVSRSSVCGQVGTNAGLCWA